MPSLLAHVTETPLQRGALRMTVYESIMIMLTFGGLIVVILSFKRKK